MELFNPIQAIKDFALAPYLIVAAVFCLIAYVKLRMYR